MADFLDINIFHKYWREKARGLASGELSLTESDLLSIAGNLDIEYFLPQYLPDGQTISGSAIQRKKAIFALAQELWGISPEAWLAKEKSWLDKSRKKNGSTGTGGKDSLEDVVSVELLVRLVAAAGIAKSNQSDQEIIYETVGAINIIVAEVCAKGRTRMKKVEGQSIYKILKDGGLMIGTGAGKYLPDPEENLYELLLFLHSSKIRPEVYGDL